MQQTETSDIILEVILYRAKCIVSITLIGDKYLKFPELFNVTLILNVVNMDHLFNINCTNDFTDILKFFNIKMYTNSETICAVIRVIGNESD